MVLSLFGWGSYARPESGEAIELEPKGKVVRTRAEQLKRLGNQEDSPAGLCSQSDLLYPGLVNISGTYCFLNAVLQALASCVYLQPFLDQLQERAEELDVPTPVIDALRDILQKLDAPGTRFQALRPSAIIEALANSSQQNHNTLFLSREHQDAQELFQLVSSVLQEETNAVQQEAIKDLGLKGLHSLKPASSGAVDLSTPFEGLSANRRTCGDCGYTEAVMHFPFDNITLALPAQSSCGLEECLLDYTRVERLTDCVCRKCSMLATLWKLGADSQRLADRGEERSPSKKKRGKEAKKLEGRVKEAIDGGRVEEDIKGVKVEKVYSSSSSKQTMIARPPPILVLHVNRSTYFGHGYAGRNSCRVYFPELLDLTPFTTGGELNLLPNVSLSAPSILSLPALLANTRAAVLYRLDAVVCHYGTHSYGHYVAFRRKPAPPNTKVRWAPPTLSCPLDCICEDCRVYGPVRDQYSGRYAGWLRMSDDNVEEVGLSAVLRETAGTFMLFYERIQMPPNPVAVQKTGEKADKTSGRIVHSVQIRNGRRTENGHKLELAAESSMDIDSSSREGSETPEPAPSEGTATVVGEERQDVGKL
ncbi:cysteine proteinase [Dacryopinax primogenitus]|uniref:ubiquitinyl hydrolase 1 n=1 Tax=Dacryopinax primogenitus (strain DJM 731) TaxID=1858805 RepID=M5GCB4_DACPD|nr:cysteine proteinase [Dacryopinax primogenitus]EJU06674.1 cysteine proteinase [Dacryopinax primogenitus]